MSIKIDKIGRTISAILKILATSDQILYDILCIGYLKTWYDICDISVLADIKTVVLSDSYSGQIHTEYGTWLIIQREK